MTDKLKSLFPVSGNFVQGEQPTHQKFSILHGLSKEGFEFLESILGDLRGDNTPNSAARTRSSQRFIADDPGGFSELAETPFRSHLLTLSKWLGPASALNSTYLSNRTHLAEDQGAGWPITPGERRQFVPFFPTEGGAVNFTGAGSFASTRVDTKEEVTGPGDYYLGPTGELLFFSIPLEGASIAYDLTTGQGDTYDEATYAVIPDCAVLGLGDREDCCLILDNATVAEDYIEVEITLPEVKYVRENLISGSQGVEEWEPVGLDDDGVKRYCLPDWTNEFHGTVASGSFYPEGAFALWNEAYQEIVPDVVFKSTGTRFELVALIPSSYSGRLKNNAGTSLVSTGTNTKDFFLLTGGVQVSVLLDQLRRWQLTHTHDGTHGSRIAHGDLEDLSGAVSTYAYRLRNYIGDNAAFPAKGLSVDGQTSWFDRVFIFSNTPDNHHPQYLHRLGYKGGGTNHTYAQGAETANADNMLMGDLVLGPVQNEDGDSGYSWETNDIARDNSVDTHSYWVGIPTGNESDIIPATRIYYSKNLNRLVDGTPVTDTSNTLFSNYGFLIGDKTAENLYTDLTLSDYAGIVFGGGNAKFGAFGRGASFGDQKPTYSFLLSEMLIAVTNNGVAKPNDSDTYRADYGHRKGFLVKAIQGASAILSTGIPGSDNDADNFDSDDFVGVAGIEAGSPDSGAFALFVPAINSSQKTFPWSRNGAPFSGWEDGLVNGMSNDGGFFWIASKFDASKDADQTASSSAKRPPKGPDSLPTSKGIIEAAKGLDIIIEFNAEEDEVQRHTAYYDSATDPEVATLGLGVISEVRFWGNLGTDTEVPRGANQNLLYGNGDSYTRFGVNAVAVDSNTDQIKNLRITVNNGKAALWGSARHAAAMSKSVDDYGSAIRQAGFIEAFSGIRHDPNFPFVATYNIPFKVVYNIGPFSGLQNNLDGIWREAITPELFIGSIPSNALNFPESILTSSSYYDATFGDLTTGTGVTILADNASTRNQKSLNSVGGYAVFLDQLIRWHDARHAERREANSPQLVLPGESIMDFSVSLDYWTNSSDLKFGESLASTALLAGLLGNTHEMTRVNGDKITGDWLSKLDSFNTTNKFVPIMGNTQKSSIGFDYSLVMTKVNSSVGSDTAEVISTASLTSYLDTLGRYQCSSAGTATNMAVEPIWGLKIVPDTYSTAKRYLPYGLLYGGESDSYMEISGTIKISFSTGYDFLKAREISYIG